MENIEIQKPESKKPECQEEDGKKPEISPEDLEVAREKFQEMQDLLEQAGVEGSEEKLEEAGRLREEIEEIMGGEREEEKNKRVRVRNSELGKNRRIRASFFKGFLGIYRTSNLQSFGRKNDD